MFKKISLLLFFLLPFFISAKSVNKNKQEVVLVPGGKLIFKNYIYTDQAIKGYYLLQYTNTLTNKTHYYESRPHNFSFSYESLSPNKKFSIIQALSQGYVELEKTRKYHEGAQAHVLFHDTGCLSRTPFRFASWTPQNTLINEDNGLEDPTKISSDQSNGDLTKAGYPWSTKRIPKGKVERKRTIEQFFADSMGISNELACTPITQKNFKYYKYLRDKLKTYKFNVEAAIVNEAIIKFKRNNSTTK